MGSGGLDGVEPDGVAESVGLAHDASHGAFGIESREVVAAEVVVVDVVGEHVPGRGENRVLDGDNGFLLAQAWGESSVARHRGRWCRGFGPRPWRRCPGRRTAT